MSAVKAPPFHPSEFARRISAAAEGRGFRSEPFGEAAGCPLVALTRRTSGPRPRVYLSAGIHGDEPAPPLALESMIEEGLFDSRAQWLMCPLLNPAGFLASTRENAGGIDLNRDYKATRSEEIAAHIRWLRRQPNFEIGLCLHEDWEATGFYLYEVNPNGRPSLAEDIIAAVRPFCPIDPAELIDGRAALGGILRPEVDPAKRELWPESIYLRSHHTTLTYTLETPSALPLEKRIAAQRAAVTAVLERLLGPRRTP